MILSLMSKSATLLQYITEKAHFLSKFVISRSLHNSLEKKGMNFAIRVKPFWQETSRKSELSPKSSFGSGGGE